MQKPIRTKKYLEQLKTLRTVWDKDPALRKNLGYDFGKYMQQQLDKGDKK